MRRIKFANFYRGAVGVHWMGSMAEEEEEGVPVGVRRAALRSSACAAKCALQNGA